MTNLSTLTDRVEQVLADTGNDIWDTTWLAEGIRQALHEYSRVRPLQKETTLTITEASRELDISAISDLLHVVEVWLPYTAANPEYPPHIRSFQHWRDLGLIYFPAYEAEAGQVARLFYLALQTISGLDSATGATVPGEDETLLVVGAAGHVAASRALDLTEHVTIDRLTAQQVRAWGLAKLQEFRSGLRSVARSQAAFGSAFVPLPPLDRWDW